MVSHLVPTSALHKAKFFVGGEAAMNGDQEKKGTVVVVALVLASLTAFLGACSTTSVGWEWLQIHAQK